MPGSTNPLGVITFIILCLPTLYGQQNTTALGGEASGIGGTLSYSIGQIAYTTADGATGSINQGVQQPYLQIMVSNQESLGSVSIRLFPNPSSSNTIIALDDFSSYPDLASFRYQLFDVYGTFLWAENIQSTLNQIQTTQLISGMYILKVFYKNQPLKTFRFIKTE